jgi:WD40 repeat protein/tRNA A-37 threonylcarbamoyl transferase component Bud32
MQDQSNKSMDKSDDAQTNNDEARLADMLTKVEKGPSSISLSQLPDPGNTNQFIGDYEFLETEEQGKRGGMGVVLKARHLRLNRLVAVKMIKSEFLSNPIVCKRFLKEAEAARKLKHEHIIRVVDCNTLSGRPFLAMDYIGKTLDDHVGSQSVEPCKAAKWIQTVARAIDYAHQEGVIHRDLKPSNILVDTYEDKSEKLVIADFGLARLSTDAGASLTSPSQVLGTPQYMAPEQLRGHGEARSDVYALGGVLYRLLVGHPPFAGATVEEIFSKVQNDEPVPPGKLDSVIPRDLESICLKCLAKEPARRYQTAADLAEDLQRFLDGMPTHARPIGWFGRLARLAKRHPVETSLTACLIVGLAVWGVWANDSRAAYFAQLQATQIQHANDLANTGRSPEALALLGAVVRANPKNSFAADRLLFLLKQSDPPLIAAPPIHDTNGLLVAQFNSDGSKLNTLSLPPNVVRCWDILTGRTVTEAGLMETNRLRFPIFTGDLRWLAAVDHKQVVRIFATANGGEYSRLVTNSAILKLAFDAGATLLRAVETNGVVLSWTNQSAWRQVQQQPAVRLDNWKSPHTLVFSEDSRRLAAALPDGHMAIWDTSTGIQLANFPHQHESAPEAQFSSDTLTLLTWDGSTDVRVWDWNLARLISLLPEKEPVHYAAISPRGDCAVTVGSVSMRATDWGARGGEKLVEAFGPPLDRTLFHPDGDRIATVSNNGEVLLWNVRTKQTRSPDLSGLADTKHAAFSPNGRFFAAAHTAGQGSAVEVLETKTAHRVGQPLLHAEQVNWLAFSRDSKWLATASMDHTARVWSVEQGSPPRVLAGHSNWVMQVEFNFDGTLLLTASDDKTARLWSTITGQEVGILAGHTGQLNSAIFSPDGTWILTTSDDKTARLWTVSPIQCVRTNAYAETIVHAAFSPNGRWAATGGADGVVQLWPLKHTAAPPQKIHVPEGVTHLTFSPDSRLLMTAGADGAASLWNTKNATLAGRPLDQKKPLVQALFSRDGDRAATLAEDGSVIVWDLRTRLQVSDPLLRKFDTALGIALDSAGERVLVYGAGGTPHLWFVPKASCPAPDWLPRLAEAAAGCSFSSTGTLQPVAAEKIFGLRQELLAAHGTNALIQWARWFLGHPDQRQSFPQ